MLRSNILVKYKQVNGLAEGQGGFLGLLNGLAHVGHEPWCSKGPCRALVVAIFWWAATRIGMIGGPLWTGVGLHVLHAQLLSTSLGYCEGYRPRGRGGPCVPGGSSLITSQTAFVNLPIIVLANKKIMDGHFSDILRLLKNVQKSYSFAAHFKKH